MTLAHWHTVFVLAALVAIALYLTLVVPRISRAAAVASTALSAGLLLFVAASARSDALTALLLALAAAALVVAHVGRLLWQHRRAPPKNDERVAASRDRRAPRRTPPPPVQLAPTSAGHLPGDSVDAIPSRGTRPARAAAPAATPKALGRYVVEHELARGGMGIVYRGTDPASGRAVALKTMAIDAELPGHALREARERFFREAEAAGRLHHPDIVRVLGVGEDQGLAYMAMELLEGGDLRRHCVAGQLLPAPQALRIAARIADALAYAHTRGVVHRDVKPSNIMIDPARDHVKVTDFGIARLADWSRTRTGVMLGTPSYMSPEQLLGQPLDGRADLYSLGALLFELLAGRLPHETDSMSRLMQAIVNRPAPDIRQLRPELPDALTHVLARALAKKPQDRYADGSAFALALRALPGVAPCEPELPGVAPCEPELP